MNLNVSQLQFRDVNTKKKLFKLYRYQFSESNLRFFLNETIKLYPSLRVATKFLPLPVVLSFFEIYGLPIGYELSPELQELRSKIELKL